MYQKLSAALLLAIFGLLAVRYSAGSPPAGSIPPEIVARVALQNQTMPIASTPVYTPTVTGLYRISAYMNGPQASTNNQWDLNLQWTDQIGLEETIIAFLQRTSANGPPLAYAFSPNVAYAQPPGIVVVQAVAGQPITYSVDPTQGSLGGIYSLYFVVERLI